MEKKDVKEKRCKKDVKKKDTKEKSPNAFALKAATE